MDESVAEARPDNLEPTTDGGMVSSPPTSGGNSGRDSWRADRGEDDSELRSLWIRWTDGGSDLHLHRSSEIIPQIQKTSSFPGFSFVPETGEIPTFTPNRNENADTADNESNLDVQFMFISGIPRQLLRHVPFLVLVATIILFVGAEFSSDIGGVSDLLPVIIGTDAILFGVFLAITPILLWLLGTVGIFDFGEFPKAAAIYGLVGLLVCGVLISVALVFTASHPSDVEPNIILVSGYLLTLLLGGMLLYEGVLRIEHLFVKLGSRDIVTNPPAYRAYLTDLYDSLNRKTVLGIHPSRVFGLLFGTQYLIIYYIGNGPQGMQYIPGLVVNFALNVIMITIVFQFFVLVRYLNLLLNETGTYSTVGLTYEPFHIDGYAGYRDFGRFAIRINAILSIAGGYVMYRLYIIGGRNLPENGLSGFEDPLVFTIWFINYIGPIVAYGLGALAWGYYSFWSMHRKMEREKAVVARRYQGPRGPPDADRTPSAGDRIDSFTDVRGPAWEAFRAAPTWPLQVNKLVSLLSGNAVPILIPVINLFF